MSFKEYYEQYISLHQNKWCRRLHVIGQLTTILFVIVCVVKTAWLMLLLAPFVIYPFAWTGHLYFEKNKPAAWSTPLWARAWDGVVLNAVLLG